MSRWSHNAKNSLETNWHYNRTPTVRINLHRTIRYRIGMVQLMLELLRYCPVCAKPVYFDAQKWKDAAEGFQVHCSCGKGSIQKIDDKLIRQAFGKLTREDLARWVGAN